VEEIIIQISSDDINFVSTVDPDVLKKFLKKPCHNPKCIFHMKIQKDFNYER